MSTKQGGVHREEQDRSTDTFVNWLSEEDRTDAGTTAGAGPCASCGVDGEMLWLRLVIDWEEYLAESHGVDRADDLCRVPLCRRCRAWAETIEIAETAVSRRSRADRERIERERDRFLDSLTIDLVEGLRVAEDLAACPGPPVS